MGQASGRRNSIRTLTCARFGGHAREGTRMNADWADSRGFVPDSSAPLRRIRVHPCSLIQRGWRAAHSGQEAARTAQMRVQGVSHFLCQANPPLAWPDPQALVFAERVLPSRQVGKGLPARQGQLIAARSCWSRDGQGKSRFRKGLRWRPARLGRERALVLRRVTKSSNNPRERRAPGCYGWFTTPNLPRPVVAFNTLRARTAVD